MNTNRGISLWAPALFVSGATLGWLYLLPADHPKWAQPAVVHSSEVLEGHKEAGLHSNYRQGGHNYLEVHYEGEWQTLKCSIKGWEQQGLYFRQNLAAVAEGCELENLVRTEGTSQASGFTERVQIEGTARWNDGLEPLRLRLRKDFNLRNNGYEIYKTA